MGRHFFQISWGRNSPAMKLVCFYSCHPDGESGTKRIRDCFVGAGVPCLHVCFVKTRWKLTSNPSLLEDTDGKCERFFPSASRDPDHQDGRGANPSIATAPSSSTWNIRENPCDFR